jgi:aminopeptidase N
MFAGHVYQRGALTLHALRATVGDEAFSQILRTYLDRFGGKAASTDDFVQLASDVAGRDLESFFDSWLGPGEPPPLPTGAQLGGAASPSSASAASPQKVLQVGQS